jgi:hypothetical protein
MGGDVAMDQAPTVVLNDHKHIQQTKGRGYGDEEIAGNDSLSVKAQEGRPAQITSRPAAGDLGLKLTRGPARVTNENP